MSEYFNFVNPDDNPGDKPPKLDIEYWATKAEGMLPGDIAHPRAYGALVMDTATKQLFVNGKAEFDGDAFEPPKGYYGERVGLLRVYLPDDEGNVLDGFVADLRPLEKAGVRSDEITNLEYAHAGPYKEEKSRQAISVLGYVYTDVNKGTSYKGDARLVDEAQYLAEAVDTARQPKDSDAYHHESVALNSLKELVGEADSESTPHADTPIADAVAEIKKTQGDQSTKSSPEKPAKKSRRWRRNR